MIFLDVKKRRRLVAWFTDLVFQLQVIVTPVPVPEQCSPLFIRHKNAAYSKMS